MKSLTCLAAALGLALLIGLVAYHGFAPVGQAVASAGWGVALVVLARALAVGGAGVGWWRLLARAGPSPSVFVVVRFVREGINGLVPVAQVGGDFVGARLLTFFGVTGTLAVASTIFDIIIQVITLVVFTAVGLGLLVLAGGDAAMISGVAIGLAIAIPVMVAFLVALRLGAFNPLVRVLIRLAESRDWPALGHAARLPDDLQRIYRDRRNLSASVLVHMVSWFFGAFEVWFALAFMGHPVSFADAIAIEAIGQAIRALAFAMPGGLGVQDGGFIALCAIFGVPAEIALALALLKRIADVVLGVPGLLAWQALESRQLLARNAVGAGPAHSAAPPSPALQRSEAPARTPVVD